MNLRSTLFNSSPAIDSNNRNLPRKQNLTVFSLFYCISILSVFTWFNDMNFLKQTGEKIKQAYHLVLKCSEHLEHKVSSLRKQINGCYCFTETKLSNNTFLLIWLIGTINTTISRDLQTDYKNKTIVLERDNKAISLKFFIFHRLTNLNFWKLKIRIFLLIPRAQKLFFGEKNVVYNLDPLSPNSDSHPISPNNQTA